MSNYKVPKEDPGLGVEESKQPKQKQTWRKSMFQYFRRSSVDTKLKGSPPSTNDEAKAVDTIEVQPIQPSQSSQTQETIVTVQPVASERKRKGHVRQKHTTGTYGSSGGYEPPAPAAKRGLKSNKSNSRADSIFTNGGTQTRSTGGTVRTDEEKQPRRPLGQSRVRAEPNMKQDVLSGDKTVVEKQPRRPLGQRVDTVTTKGGTEARARGNHVRNETVNKLGLARASEPRDKSSRSRPGLRNAAKKVLATTQGAQGFRAAAAALGNHGEAKREDPGDASAAVTALASAIKNSSLKPKGALAIFGAIDGVDANATDTMEPLLSSEGSGGVAAGEHQRGLGSPTGEMFKRASVVTSAAGGFAMAGKRAALTRAVASLGGGGAAAAILAAGGLADETLARPATPPVGRRDAGVEEEKADDDRGLRSILQRGVLGSGEEVEERRVEERPRAPGDRPKVHFADELPAEPSAVVMMAPRPPAGQAGAPNGATYEEISAVLTQNGPKRVDVVKFSTSGPRTQAPPQSRLQNSSRVDSVLTRGGTQGRAEGKAEQKKHRPVRHMADAALELSRADTVLTNMRQGVLARKGAANFKANAEHAKQGAGAHGGGGGASDV